MPKTEALRLRRQEIRQTHHYGFRSGEWAELLGFVDHSRGRRCYSVRFLDGTTDFWPVDDPVAGYEIRSSAPEGK